MYKLVLLLLLVACGCAAMRLPEPTPTSTPCPTPTPTPKPAPGLFNAPDVVPVSAPFPVTLCRAFEPGTVLYIDSYKLGTFGHHRPTGCMLVLVPGLTTAGERTLKVGDLSRPITVFAQQDVK
jgi:hypothetical protein